VAGKFSQGHQKVVRLWVKRKKVLLLLTAVASARLTCFSFIVYVFKGTQAGSAGFCRKKSKHADQRETMNTKKK